MSTCILVNLSFWELIILSTCQQVKFVILCTCQFLKLSACHLVSLSFNVVNNIVHNDFWGSHSKVNLSHIVGITHWSEAWLFNSSLTMEKMMIVTCDGGHRACWEFVAGLSMNCRRKAFIMGTTFGDKAIENLQC